MTEPTPDALSDAALDAIEARARLHDARRRGTFDITPGLVLRFVAEVRRLRADNERLRVLADNVIESLAFNIEDENGRSWLPAALHRACLDLIETWRRRDTDA